MPGPITARQRPNLPSISPKEIFSKPKGQDSRPSSTNKATTPDFRQQRNQKTSKGTFESDAASYSSTPDEGIATCGSPFFDALLSSIGSGSAPSGRQHGISNRSEIQHTASIVLSTGDFSEYELSSVSGAAGQHSEVSSLASESVYGSPSKGRRAYPKHSNADRTTRNPFDYEVASSNSSSTSNRPIEKRRENASIKGNAGTSQIVAPNVGKLGEASVVEVRIQSAEETVAVLCAIDVLKMRSQYFYDILSKRVESSSSRDDEHGKKTRRGLLLPVVLNDVAPFECASFLESLHDGKCLTACGEWSFHWARLAVLWAVQDVVCEIAAVVDKHVDAMLNRVDLNCWRTNCDVLSGFRVAIFRRTSSAVPTILTGTILDGNLTTGPNAIRLSFDQKTPSTPKTKWTPAINTFTYSGASGRVKHELLRDTKIDNMDGWDDFAQSSTACELVDCEADRQMLSSGTVTLEIKEPIW